MASTLTWELRAVQGNTNGLWESVCWSAEQNKFVAVASGTASSNYVMNSTDGITWTEIPNATSGALNNGWRTVCWGKEANIFVAVGNNGTNRVMTSPNGINWTIRSVPDTTNQWFDVCWSPQLTRFVAVAEWSTTNSNRVMTSSDGINWTPQATPSYNWVSVCWSPQLTRFVAVAYMFSNPTSHRVMTSSDGFSWTLQLGTQTNGWTQVCWSPLRTLFVAVADNGSFRIATSSDGFTWQGSTQASTAQFRGVCWSQEAQLFVAVAWGGANRLWTSPDGFNWTSTTPPEISGWYDVCWSKERNMFAATARNAATVNKVMTAYGPVVNTVPSVPQTLTAAAGNSQVILNWSIPASTGGSAILEYIVTMNSVATPTNSTATTRTINGLINGTSYTFTVTARNAIGTSGSSNSVSATPFTAPSAPIIGTVTAGNSNVTVTWSAGATNGSTRSGYIIQRSENQTNWTNHTAGSNDSSLTISGLTNGTTYYFRVITQSNAGNSAQSSTLSAVPFTTPSAPIIGTAISRNNSAIVNWTPLYQGSSDIITFTTVGSFNFTAPRSGTVEVLIVGGGGGGGRSIGGGGGGGGVIYMPAVNVIAGTNYPVVVGEGGPSSINGSSSSVFGATAAGGGSSGEWQSGFGKTGGSGGGAAAQRSTNRGGDSSGNSLGSNSGFMYGNRGGHMTTERTDVPTRAAGGGGAGGQGLDTNTNIIGDTGQTGMGSGGIGIVNSILGPSYYWGGGGGGGAHDEQVGGYGGLGGGGGGWGGLQGNHGGLGGGSALNSGITGIYDAGAGGTNTGGGGGGGSLFSPGGAGGSGIVVIRYNATNGSNVTGYIVTDNYGVSTPLISGINTSTTTINGLTNGKTYTFKVKAVSSNAGNSIDSNPSNIVLPISPTPITTGSNFIGRTLVIGSTALINSNPHYARIFDFHIGSTSQYIYAPFRVYGGYLIFVATPFNAGEIIQEYNTYVPSINTYYIYVISFVSEIQLKVNVYVYNSSTIDSTHSVVKTINMPNTVLPGLNNFWLGRSIFEWDDFYNGIYNKIALYNGDLLALSQETVLSTLLTLVQSTESNVYYNDLNNYAFRPVINNFIGVVVNRLNANTTTGSTATTSNITLIGTGASSGGYLNITGSFVELSTAPIIQTATVGSGNGQIIVNWTPPVNNGGNISNYTVTSNPQGRTSTVNGTTITTTFSELTISTSYTFTVVAINAAGTSPPSAASNPVTAITTTTVPSAPTSVTAISGPNIREIKVSWSKPSNGGTSIIEYQIRNYSNELVATVSGETTLTATVSSLTIGTSYSFTVKARNSVGLSDPSNPSTPITPLTFSFNGTQNYVGGKLDISHNYTQNDIFFYWYSSSIDSFISPTVLSNPNNRNYLFIRLEYQKLYIRCIVNFNTNTYTSSSVLIQEKYNPESFDYNITINTSGQKQTLFNTATYNYPSISTPPVFTFNLSLTNISSFLSSSSSLTSRSNSLTIINGLESSLRPFGERLLEIVAIKIFGHPKARAAISNDNSFYNITQLSTKVFDTLNNQRNELGNYYMGIYDIQPNSTSQTINVNNFNIIFPFFLNGATQKSSINLFRNGPNVGGSLLRNGQYNIPLLLTFI